MTRTTKEQLIEFAGDEPEAFCPGCHSSSCRGRCMQNAYRPTHVEAPSAEDYEEGPGLFIWVALALWSVLMFACGWTARYFF